MHEWVRLVRVMEDLKPILKRLDMRQRFHTGWDVGLSQGTGQTHSHVHSHLGQLRAQNPPTTMLLESN